MKKDIRRALEVALIKTKNTFNTGGGFYATSIFKKDYWANLTEIFRNFSKSFDDHSVIYVTPTYDFRLQISFGILKTLPVVAYDDEIAYCL